MKSKKILAAAIVSALVISAASGAFSAFAATRADVEDELENKFGNSYEATTGTVTVSISYVDEDGNEVDTGEASVTIDIDDASTYAEDSSGEYVFDETTGEYRTYDAENDYDVVTRYRKEENYTYDLTSATIPVEAPDGYVLADAAATYNLGDLESGKLTVEVKESGDTDTDTDTNGDTDEEDEEWYVSTDYTDGWFWYSGGGESAIFDSETGTLTVTAPDAIENELNEFVEWSYEVFYNNGEDYRSTELQSVGAGETVSVSIDEGYEPTVVTFYAVWEDPEGKVAVNNANAFLGLFADANKGDKGYDDTPAWEILDDKGNPTGTYFVWLGTITAEVSGVYDLKEDVFTPNKGSGITIPKDVKVPEKKGYTFVGWNTKRDGSGKTYKSGDLVPITDQYTELYAIYEKDGNPGTGDDFSAVPFVGAAVVALGTAAGVMVYKKKRDLAEEAE